MYVHGMSPSERKKQDRAFEVESARQEALKGMPSQNHGESTEDHNKRIAKHVSQYHPDVRHALAHSYEAPHFEGSEHAKRMAATIRSTLDSSQHSEEDAPDYNPHFVYGGGVVAPPVPMSRETTTQHSEQPSPPQVSSFGAGVRY